MEYNCKTQFNRMLEKYLAHINLHLKPTQPSHSHTPTRTPTFTPTFTMKRLFSHFLIWFKQYICSLSLEKFLNRGYLHFLCASKTILCPCIWFQTSGQPHGYQRRLPYSRLKTLPQKVVFAAGRTDGGEWGGMVVVGLSPPPTEHTIPALWRVCFEIQKQL